MPTTVHIPNALLASVDRKARSLHLSRNRLIVRALTREVHADAAIAAHALAVDGALVTASTRHFTRIAGLRVEDWTA